jgi:hypothetical protein
MISIHQFKINETFLYLSEEAELGGSNFTLLEDILQTNVYVIQLQ